jgi:hypothetical protein
MLFTLILGAAFLIGAVFLLFVAIVLVTTSYATAMIVAMFFALVWLVARRDWGIARRYRQGQPPRARTQKANIPEQFIPHHRIVPPECKSSMDPPSGGSTFDPWGIS